MKDILKQAGVDMMLLLAALAALFGTLYVVSSLV